jgi:hypothetical protein
MLLALLLDARRHLAPCLVELDQELPPDEHRHLSPTWLSPSMAVLGLAAGLRGHGDGGHWPHRMLKFAGVTELRRS